jgi:hypothetical protein
MTTMVAAQIGTKNVKERHSTKRLPEPDIEPYVHVQKGLTFVLLMPGKTLP